MYATLPPRTRLPEVVTLTHPFPDRTKKVREARDEAKKEIEAYRAKKEAEFKKFEAEVSLMLSSRGDEDRTWAD